MDSGDRDPNIKATGRMFKFIGLAVVAVVVFCSVIFGAVQVHNYLTQNGKAVDQQLGAKNGLHSRGFGDSVQKTTFGENIGSSDQGDFGSARSFSAGTSDSDGFGNTGSSDQGGFSSSDSGGVSNTDSLGDDGSLNWSNSLADDGSLNVASLECATCTALNQCHDIGACDPTTGVCSNPEKADNTNCDDGYTSTINDVCTNGYCAGTGCRYGQPEANTNLVGEACQRPDGPISVDAWEAKEICCACDECAGITCGTTDTGCQPRLGSSIGKGQGVNETSYIILSFAQNSWYWSGIFEGMYVRCNGVDPECMSEDGVNCLRGEQTILENPDTVTCGETLIPTWCVTGYEDEGHWCSIARDLLGCQEADPTCATGLKSSTTPCCLASCGTCGGSGCSLREGGWGGCCMGAITDYAPSCIENMPPCNVR